MAGICRSILPPYIADAIARNGSPEDREIALRSAAADHALTLFRSLMSHRLDEERKT